MHTHHDEDEFSYILEGEVGLQLGDREFVAGAGTLVTKPRGVPHAFWNPGDQPARLLELISPPGFEAYFAAMAEVFAAGGPDPERMAQIARRYNLDIDPASVARISQAHGLQL